MYRFFPGSSSRIPSFLERGRRLDELQLLDARVRCCSREGPESVACPMSLHLCLSVDLLQADLGDHLAVLSVEIVNRSRREVTIQDVGFEGEGQPTSVLDVCDGVSWSALLDFPPPLTICSGEKRAFGLSLQLFGDFLESHTVPLTFRAWADSAERVDKPSGVWSDLWLAEREQRLFVDLQPGLWLRPLPAEATHLP